MKKIMISLSILAATMLACSITVNMTPEPSSNGGESGDVGSATTVPPTSDAPAAPSTIPANLFCNEVSLYLEPVLGSSFACETVPESTGSDMGILSNHPAYTKISIAGYPLAGTFFNAQISVYPVQRFRELVPDVGGEVTDLQSLIGGAMPGSNAYPFLPYFNAGQVFHAQYAMIPFQNGSGIRYLTLYAQYTAPINNHDLFYTFQGLTTDGQYWISVILPVSHSILPANGDNPPDNMSWETFSNNYESYTADIKAQLEAQSEDSYMPSLIRLDALIESMLVEP